jgi:hypothetical protein
MARVLVANHGLDADGGMASVPRRYEAEGQLRIKRVVARGQELPSRVLELFPRFLSCLICVSSWDLGNCSCAGRTSSRHLRLDER